MIGRRMWLAFRIMPVGFPVFLMVPLVLLNGEVERSGEGRDEE
jgi:hypothetical protein